MTEILRVSNWANNAELMVDVARLEYFPGSVLDCTYGLGKFWTKYRPSDLYGSDLDPTKAPDGKSTDFRKLPWTNYYFQTVVFDPPYKLNGTPDPALDGRYGVEVPTRWQDRITLMEAGLIECCRVANLYVLVKCQDQVCSGQIRWQTDIMTRMAEKEGMRKRDRFDMLAYRPQPDGVRQLHTRTNTSTLLVFTWDR